MSIRRHTISFKHAGDGIFYAFTRHPNFRVHAVAAILAIFLGLSFRLTSLEWIILAFTISLVIIVEMVNTAIESVVDLLTDKYHLKAKLAKDVSAGMVLVSAVLSLVVAATIFIPYILNFKPY